MRHSQNYNLRLPERLPERTDPADIDDLTYDIESIDGILKSQDTEDKRLERDKVNASELNAHKTAGTLDHPDDSVTDAKLGDRTVLSTKGTLQTLLTAIGNAVKAITGAEWGTAPATTLAEVRAHIEDGVRHVTGEERTLWSTVRSKLGLEGGTLTGYLTLHKAPTNSLHAATKQYVDDSVGEAGGGDMSKAEFAKGGVAGAVDRATTADSVAWGNVSGRPSSLPASGGNADKVQGSPAYRLQSVTTEGGPYGANQYDIQSRFNAKSDGRFRLEVVGSTDAVNYIDKTSVGYADVAGSASITYTATIGTGWSGNPPCNQWVGVSGLLATDNPIVDLILSGDVATDRARLESWGMVGRITTAANQITVTCYEDKPLVAMPIQLKVVR